MNHLSVLGEDEWRLPPHAHVIVHEARDGDELLTIYDGGFWAAPQS